MRVIHMRVCTGKITFPAAGVYSTITLTMGDFPADEPPNEPIKPLIPEPGTPLWETFPTKRAGDE